MKNLNKTAPAESNKPTAPKKSEQTPEAIRFVQMLRRLHPDAKLKDCLDENLNELYTQFPGIESAHAKKVKKEAEEKAAALAEREEYEQVRQAEIQAQREQALEREL